MFLCLKQQIKGPCHQVPIKGLTEVVHAQPLALAADPILGIEIKLRHILQFQLFYTTSTLPFLLAAF